MIPAFSFLFILDRTLLSAHKESRYRRIIKLEHMQRKIFWLSFAALGLIADLVLPFWWAVAATIPCGLVAW